MDPSFGGNCCELELSLSCKNVKVATELLGGSKRSPNCMIALLEHLDDDWVEIGRTEVVAANHDPSFTKQFILDCPYFDMRTIRFVLLDVKDPNRPAKCIDDEAVIGEEEISLADLASNPAKPFDLELVLPSKKRFSKGSSHGTLTVVAEEVQETAISVRLQFVAEDVFKPKKPKTQGILTMYRAALAGGSSERAGGQNWVSVYSSEATVNSNTGECEWEPIMMSAQKLCNGHQDRVLKLEISKSLTTTAKSEVVGSFETTLRLLLSKEREKFYVIPAKKKSRHGKSQGFLRLLSARWRKEHSFLEYIAGGCSISLIVAVDFTASNGIAQFPSSLHFLGHGQPSEYERAIEDVGSVLAPYDSNGKIAAYGFGAKLPGETAASHCFPLNGDKHDAHVEGLPGVLECYRNTAKTVDFSGPSRFELVLKKVRFSLKQCSGTTQAYTIVLILTTGIIGDMRETIDEIVHLSKMPVSIVIAGVGDANFDEMMKLDADLEPLEASWGERAERDIVQFVPLRHFGRSRVSRETLREIPEQFLSYMRSKNIQPQPSPPSATLSSPSYRPSYLRPLSNFNILQPRQRPKRLASEPSVSRSPSTPASPSRSTPMLRTPDRGYSVPNLKVSDDSSATHPECSDGKGPALPHSHDRSASVPNISEDLGESRHHIPGTASAPGLGSQSASVSSATAVGAKSKTKPTKTKTKLRHRFYAARQKPAKTGSSDLTPDGTSDHTRRPRSLSDNAPSVSGLENSSISSTPKSASRGASDQYSPQSSRRSSSSSSSPCDGYGVGLATHPAPPTYQQSLTMQNAPRTVPFGAKPFTNPTASSVRPYSAPYPSNIPKRPPPYDTVMTQLDRFPKVD